MVVWDFDLTLSKFHTFHAGILSKKIASEYTTPHIIDSVFADFPLFSKVSQRLKEKKIGIGIATYKFEEVVCVVVA